MLFHEGVGAGRGGGGGGRSAYDERKTKKRRHNEKQKQSWWMLEGEKCSTDRKADVHVLGVVGCRGGYRVRRDVVVCVFGGAEGV